MVQTGGEMHNVQCTPHVMFSDVNQEAEKEGKKGFSTGCQAMRAVQGSDNTLSRGTHIVNADYIENLLTF